MNTEHTKYLYETYPNLYRQHSLPMTETCMCWNFECGDGWFDIIRDLSEVLTKLDAELGTKTEAVQVKEKFGSLRFYVSGGTELHDEAINDAECQSADTCEVCGKPGTLRRGGWLVTLCDECDNKKGRP